MGTNRKISEQDANRVELFKDLITVGAEAEEVRKALTEVFFDYSRMLIKKIPEGDAVVSEYAETAFITSLALSKF